jgi:GWxTD domain-containing protein
MFMGTSVVSISSGLGRVGGLQGEEEREQLKLNGKADMTIRQAIWAASLAGLLMGGVISGAYCQEGEAASVIQLGYDQIERGEADSAAAAFNRAVKLGAKAQGMNGLGKVMVAKGRNHYRQAFKYYRQSLGADKKFVEAQLNIARLHAYLRDRDTKGAYRRAIKMAPERPEGYIELANFLVDTEGLDAGPEVDQLLAAYIERETKDPAGYVLWMESLADRAMVREIRNVSSILLERFPQETGFLPAIGQAEAAAGQVNTAMDHWRRYLTGALEETRWVYDDLSRVAVDEKVSSFAALTDATEREAFLIRFWQDRDASSGLSGNGARAEHYRRVWYSIRNYSRGNKPFDKRGDVYVRYGEPDYRSKSGFPNLPPTGAAELVRERLYNEIGINPPSGSSRDQNVDSWFVERRDPKVALDAPLTEPVYPLIGVGDTKWESWIYSRIGGGVEFVFVDIALNGNFSFPQPPSGANVPSRVLARLVEHHPGKVYDALASEEPQHYDFPFGFAPLEFYYDVATFRGTMGRTRLEVYFGVPTEHLERAKLKDGRTIHAVERTLTLRGGPEDQAFRKNDVGGYEAPEGRPNRTLVEQASLDVPAGDYRLNVEVLDRASGKWGIYSQDIQIPAIPASLAISDLNLAWSVSASPTDPRFRKHIDGLDPEMDVWVIPLPSRSYAKGRPFNIYYEVYGLTRDEFGQTRYQVTYTVDQQIRKGTGVFGAIGTMFRRAVSNREPLVSIGYDATGATVDEPVYLEIDTKELKPGYNRVTVVVRDQVSGQVAQRDAIMRLVDR